MASGSTGRRSARSGRVRDEGEERLSAAEEAPISHSLESARTLLGETEFNQAWARGRELDGRAALGEAFSHLAGRDGSGRAGTVL